MVSEKLEAIAQQCNGVINLHESCKFLLDCAPVKGAF